jgi:uncharacterized protein (DUF849 family)
VAAAVIAVRQACPTVPVGVTTGLWISEGDAGQRLAAVTRWAGLPSAARPDFASVNVGEPGVADLLEAQCRAGIAAEAGVWSTADVETLASTGSATWIRILVEIVDGSAETAVPAADAILAGLDESRVTGPRLLHGEGAACWPLVAQAGRLSLPTRTGFEDTVTGPAGEPVTGNADLVRRALTTWSAAASSHR